MQFICYSKCTTCQKARKWLEAKGLSFKVRDIKENNPTFEELQQWYALSGLPLKRFFNTSGQQYKNLNLKDKLPTMTDEEQLSLLASDGMLVKRPLLLGQDFVHGVSFILVGFKETEWEGKFVD